MKTSEQIYMEIKIPSNTQNAEFVVAAIASFASQLKLKRDKLGDMMIAVRESVNNAIIHAYPNTVEEISIRATIQDDTVEVKVTDWGCGIENIEKARMPLFTTCGEKRTGMGFTIIETFADDVKIESKPGEGTTVIMRFHIAQEDVFLKIFQN